MWQQNLTADAKHRKCAKVVGDVMGRYHPHGDSSIYDALVRMAQPFRCARRWSTAPATSVARRRHRRCHALHGVSPPRLATSSSARSIRTPSPSARTTTAPRRAGRAAGALPNLLVNGATGIAVGMATNIPPHNPERSARRSQLLEARAIVARAALPHHQGAGFSDRRPDRSRRRDQADLRDRPGHDRSARTWDAGRPRETSKTVHITSIPYALNKATLVERIADVALSRKMPMLLDVKDVSTDDVCIELELKKEADENMVFAYLFKHTPLQNGFAVNLTCLVPTEKPRSAGPSASISRDALAFPAFPPRGRHKRLENELKGLEADAHPRRLRESLRRARSNHQAHPQLGGQGRRGQEDHGEVQARRRADRRDLELKLYRLARLENLVIKKELDERKRARRSSAARPRTGRWAIVRKELESLVGSTARRAARQWRVNGRRRVLEEELIVEDANYVLFTTDGWVKRQREVKDIRRPASARATACSLCGSASTEPRSCSSVELRRGYTARFIDIPATTGYGEPIQKLFKFKDGERILTAFSLDSAGVGGTAREDRTQRGAYAVAATSDGFLACVRLEPFSTPSTRAGRASPGPREGAQVVGVGARARQGDAHRRHPRPPRLALRRQGSELPHRPGPRRHPDQAGSRRTTACSGSSPRPAIAT